MSGSSDVNLDDYAFGLSLGDDGIWHGPSSQKVSYPHEDSDLFFSIEDRSFWFQHRNDCIRAAVSAHPPPGVLFDIGGGNGVVAAMLQRSAFETVLVEPSLQACRNAASRGIEWIVHSSAEATGFQESCLPAVGLFDVVEHIEDDTGFLEWVASRLIPGGRLYLTAPAHRLLWSDEDERAGHFRRYSRSGITEKVRKAGLSVLFQTSIFRPLTLPILLLRALPSRFLARVGPDPAAVHREHGTSGSMMTGWLNPLLRAELRAIEKGRSQRGGSSLLLAAEKGRD